MKKFFKDPDFMIVNGAPKVSNILDWIYLTNGADAHELKDFVDRSIKLWELEEQNIIRFTQNSDGTQIVEYPESWTWQDFLQNIGIEGPVRELFEKFSSDPNVTFNFPRTENGEILDFNNTTF